jgi:hypothetical protein
MGTAQRGAGILLAVTAVLVTLRLSSFSVSEIAALALVLLLILVGDTLSR